MFLPHVIHWVVTPAVGLVTNPKNVQVKEVNQGRALPTHQQEELVNLGRPMQEYFKIIRQSPTVRHTLWNGYMNLIKEVLEVPKAQSGVGHATMLVALLHIVLRWDVMGAVALGTKLKIAWIQEDNLWGMPHTHPQEKLMNHGRRIIQGYNLEDKYLESKTLLGMDEKEWNVERG